jgi:glyoxylase-like metal-dependent hydrolase (beta-lactamase superfamily II)
LALEKMMKKIEDGIYYETSYPGVTLGAVFCSQATILIDAPLRAEDARSWLASLLNFEKSTQHILVNLDAHPDRTLGNRHLDCMIIMHQRTAQIFKSRPSIFKGQNADSGAEWETFDEVLGSRWTVADITYSQSVHLHYGEEVIIEHHPGSSAGTTWVNIPSAGVLFVGDTVLVNQPPFLANADLPAWIDTLNVLIKSYRDYKIVSGRGGLVTLDDVRAQQKHLKKILRGLERLRKRNAAPESVEGLILNLLSDYSFPAKNKGLYTSRYKHGLYQYYARRYRPSEASNE